MATFHLLSFHHGRMNLYAAFLSAQHRYTYLCVHVAGTTATARRSARHRAPAGSRPPCRPGRPRRRPLQVGSTVTAGLQSQRRIPRGRRGSPRPTRDPDGRSSIPSARIPAGSQRRWMPGGWVLVRPGGGGDRGPTSVASRMKCQAASCSGPAALRSRSTALESFHGAAGLPEMAWWRPCRTRLMCLPLKILLAAVARVVLARSALKGERCASSLKPEEIKRTG